MASILAGLVVKIGSRHSDAKAAPVAISDPTPLVVWTLPAGFNQKRYSVRISNVEFDPDGWAFAQSGPINSSDRHWQFPTTVDMNSNFEGLCKVEVSVSANVAGDFEYISNPLYYVYDRRMERFYYSRQIRVKWVAPLDPDFKPVGGDTFNVQISTGEQFATTIYDNTNALPIEPTFDVGDVVHFDVPGYLFDPKEQTTYFYRVRMWDGMDWGTWSKTNAFRNYNHLPPTFKFISVTPMNNDFGDVVVVYKVDDDSDSVCAEIDYDGLPISTVESDIYFPPGTKAVVWRTYRQLGPKLVQGVVLRGRAYDGELYSNDDLYGPFDVDNSRLRLGGNLGSIFWKYLVGGRMELAQPFTPVDELYPVKLYENIWQKPDFDQLLPAAAGRYLWHQVYQQGPLETFDIGVAWQRGVGHNAQPTDPEDFSPFWWFVVKPQRGVRDVYWQAPMAFFNVFNGPEWQFQGTFEVDAHRFNASATSTKFLFASPVDNTAADTLPKAYSSKSTSLNPCLVGYVDLDGTTKSYPNEYDWNSRPPWHVGREVYADGDAWVQVMYRGRTDKQPCATCGGRSYVVAPASGQFIRVACPNPNCYSGFDITQPITQQFGTKTKVVVKLFKDIKWYRLSTFLTQGLRTRDRQMPMDVNVATPLFTKDSDEREPVRGSLAKRVQTDVEVTENLPAALGRVKTKGDFDETPNAVKGTIGPKSKKFKLNGVDPASNPGHANRRKQAQYDNFRVSGRMERFWRTRDLDFRFVPAWWDAFITLHYAQTGSASSRVQVQYAPVNSDGTTGAFKDVPGTNAEFDTAYNAYLVQPLTFHAYWATHDPMAFIEATSFRLRIRTVDKDSHTISEWLYSDVVQILHRVTNPVSMMGMTYDSFTKWVQVTFRIDDSQADLYDLVRFWYSTDDGYTWFDISSGDIYGDQQGLTSGTGETTPVHTIQWDTRPYNLKAGDEYRIKIEVIPTGFLDTAVIPYFKWSAPLNPGIDEAENTLADVVGRVEKLELDPDTARWTLRDTPIYNPGRLYYLNRELQSVRGDPPNEGIYAYVTPFAYTPIPVPSGSIPDPSGWILPGVIDDYVVWRNSKYLTGETNGAAMRRIGEEMDRLINVTIPQAQEDVIDGEREIRRNLIRQGYYAEANFLGTSPNIEESIMAATVSNQFGDPMPATLKREWKFRVQGTATGGDGLYDQNDQQLPTVTILERVYYRVQLDRTSTFDSVSGKPLRDFVYNAGGERISAAGFFGGKTIQNFAPNAHLAETQQDDGQPWEGQPSDRDGANQFTGIADPTQYPIGIYGGTLKVPPEQLPGEVVDDVLPQGQVAWDGTYYWRFCAYNAITAANTAKPRQQITAATLNVPLNQILVSYKMQGHDNVVTADITDYAVSRAFKPVSTWDDISPFNYVSDRRAPATAFATSNTIPWVPKGTDRPHPCVVWDDAGMQYHVFTTKKTYDGVKYRIVHGSGMALPDVCEMDVLFDGGAELGIYRPWVVRGTDRWYMFMTVQPAIGNAFIAASESFDLENWSAYQAVSGVLTGINPTAVFTGGYFHLFIEKLDAGSGRVKIYKAIGTTPYSMAMDNAAAAVYSESSDVGCPSVILNNGSWVMWFNVANTVASVVSANGIAWSGRRVELSGTVLTPAGPTAIPKNPCVYKDRYGGNDELFLAFNYFVSGTNLAYRARLEDRVWVSTPDSLTAAAGEAVEAASSKVGVSHSIYLDALAHGVVSGDPVKVRLFTDNVSPATIEYRRQSEWIDLTNVDDLDGYMDPQSYYYNSLLPNFPYMGGPE
jgi:hypothetical protein